MYAQVAWCFKVILSNCQRQQVDCGVILAWKSCSILRFFLHSSLPPVLPQRKSLVNMSRHG